ncbi:uncharacterized protein CTRU02_213201 [Colletotrichum truncatum]|uniref:Uncharacterized protein n=1 Tax=Colletotrichum truncatum TaxID=5467 RepID=A0ACC3YK59_COLTU|nr:uncharacterized protein CTRU02_12580 [Colletotrichum truncatum]KAF6784318.1 hypothetical protein CTRU02_12580 [Colletotrichum truncatum]
MRLPLEIVEQVFSHYVVAVPSKEFQSIASLKEWLAFTAFTDHAAILSGRNNDWHKTAFFYTDIQDLKSLLNLRLVSRQWNLSVARLLRKHMWWNIRLHNEACCKTIIECCDTKSDTMGESIRKLSLDDMDDLQTFERTYSYDHAEHFGEDVDDNFIVLNSTSVDVLGPRDKSTMRVDCKLHYDKSKEHAMVRRLFDTLTCIEDFSVTFPGASSRPELIGECYDMEGLDETISTLQYGLKSSAFQYLVKLNLAVPCTWHVGQLASVMVQEARDRLKDLRVAIVDETGPGGSPWYFIIDDDYNDGDLTDILSSGYGPSNLQVAYPNREHQDSLWKFVSSCRNLESLAIEASHYLHLDRLEWNPISNMRGLRDLSLYRLWTNVSTLLKLLSASPGSKQYPRARRVFLRDVKIYGGGGNWEEVFKHLRTKCPDLELFFAEQLTYFTNHPRHLHNNRPWENYNSIWTEPEDETNLDWSSLRKLNRKMVNKAGKKDYYPLRVFDSDMESETDEPPY